MKYGTLLVIDDNPSILTALKICLNNTFERILTLSRPDTAPMLLQQEQVDLILLDMNFSLGVNSGQYRECDEYEIHVLCLLSSHLSRRH